ncbi:glycosyltransferase family 2 protein [Paenibacillus ehimensis]|uniref:Glycosyltransferase n=1 Tax=Paenibacillus ehimensis TaxID=79264 RepID=A0ABT8VH44_9BACL|nr:glycosyltransferase [Paenibacillus ehimensis]MDO3680297.1 glycosyltransferase [Paenibacillus ehimensis]
MISFLQQCKIYIKKMFLLFGIKFNYRMIFFGERWYSHWIKENENYSPTDVKSEIGSFTMKPLISIIIPVYNVNKIYLEECINSVLNQYYEDWELCIADDNSTYPHIKEVLEFYRAKDKRIKIIYREENGHISQCTNSALELATGEYTALLDNDDVLPPFALYEIVKTINSFPNADLIYSNEDKLLEGKRVFPFFKKKWDNQLIMAINYVCHLAVFRTAILKKIGGFRKGFEGAQDWDLVLRFTEVTSNIIHVPKILYHWRMSDSSTSVNQDRKPYVQQAQKKTKEEAKKRRYKGDFL